MASGKTTHYNRRISQIEEYDAWQLTALACELNNQQGVPWNCGAYFGIYDIW